MLHVEWLPKSNFLNFCSSIAGPEYCSIKNNHLPLAMELVRPSTVVDFMHGACRSAMFGLANSIASGKWLFLIEQYSGPAMELRELARGDLGLRWMVTHEHGNVVDII